MFAMLNRRCRARLSLISGSIRATDCIGTSFKAKDTGQGASDEHHPMFAPSAQPDRFAMKTWKVGLQARQVHTRRDKHGEGGA